MYIRFSYIFTVPFSYTITFNYFFISLLPSYNLFSRSINPFPFILYKEYSFSVCLLILHIIPIISASSQPKLRFCLLNVFSHNLILLSTTSLYSQNLFYSYSSTQIKLTDMYSLFFLPSNTN